MIKRDGVEKWQFCHTFAILKIDRVIAFYMIKLKCKAYAK